MKTVLISNAYLNIYSFETVVKNLNPNTAAYEYNHIKIFNPPNFPELSAFNTGRRLKWFCDLQQMRITKTRF